MAVKPHFIADDDGMCRRCFIYSICIRVISMKPAATMIMFNQKKGS